MEAKKKPDEKDKVRASPTESEATVMKVADGGFRPAYNVHYAADRDALVIVGVAVIAAGSAMGRLAPMPDQIHERFDARPAEVLADGGLASLDDIEAAGAAPRDATVCAPVPTPKDPERDRHEPLPGDGPSVAAWRQRMKAEEAKGVYKQRASTAECVNTQARSRGLIRLLARGLDKVKAVAVWLAVAHNLACGSRLRAGATA